jgi:hypothetical protein
MNVVVLVAQVFDQIVLGFVGPVHGMVGDLEYVGEGLVLEGAVFGAEVVKVGTGKGVHFSLL